MARLIDAKALEKQIKEAFEDTNPVLMGQMLRWVRKQTTIDAVPVVRCKDCKRCAFGYIRSYLGWCSEWKAFVKANGFCHKGERRTDE